MGIFCGLFAGRNRRRNTKKTNVKKKSVTPPKISPEERRARRIMIMKFGAALFFPIFLETMDYTGRRFDFCLSSPC